MTPVACAKFVPRWLEIGRANLWIRRASDPAFDRNSFTEYRSVTGLHATLIGRNWALGTACCFWYGDHAFCFINQMEGGDEWLVCRDGISFESCTGHACWPTVEDLCTTLARWARATDQQLKKLEY